MKRFLLKVRRYALLDTDFISKTHHIQNDAGTRLADLIVKIPNFSYYCHNQIVEELGRHQQAAIKWLQRKIDEKVILCYTDQMILEELDKFYGQLGCVMYSKMLKEACDAFSRTYFHEHYSTIENFEFLKSTSHNFLDELKKADVNVGKHNSLGEIKSFVLLQFLTLLNGDEIYVFFSDDKVARSGAISFSNVRCISVLSAFLRLKKELLWTIKDAEPYINSYLKLCFDHHQDTFKV